MEVLNQVAHFSGYGATGCWKVQTPVDGVLKSPHIRYGIEGGRDTGA